jgi:hypothetical protein
MCAERLTRRAASAALAVFCIFAVGCKRSEKPNPVSRAIDNLETKIKPEPILQVESAEYTNEDLKAYFKIIDGSDSGSLSAEAMSRLFDRFVGEKILLEAARRQNLTVTWEEKKSYLAKRAGESLSEHSDAYPGSLPPDSLFDGLLVDKYVSGVIRDIPVGDAEIAAYYEEHKKDFLLPERVQVSQILVPTEEKAVSILRRLADAPEDEFRKIAREESSGPEAFKGGVMGVFKQGELPHDMENVIFALDEGKISQVVESSYGYHIFRLDKRFPPQLESLADAASKVRVRVLAQKIKDALEAHLAQLKQTLNWKAYPERLFFPYQRSDS